MGEGRTSKYSNTEQTNLEKWPVPSRQLVSLLEERLQGSSWPPRLPGSQLLPPEESRSPTDTGQEPSLSVRSEDTRSLPSSSSGSCPSSVSREKLLRISRLILGSSLLPLVLSRRPVRHTSLDCLRTLTCVLSTPSVSPLCQRTSSLLAVSAENVPKFKQTLSLPVFDKILLICFWSLCSHCNLKVYKVLPSVERKPCASDGAPRYTLADLPHENNSATNIKILSSIVFLTFSPFFKCYGQ